MTDAGWFSRIVVSHRAKVSATNFERHLDNALEACSIGRIVTVA